MLDILRGRQVVTVKQGKSDIELAREIQEVLDVPQYTLIALSAYRDTQPSHSTEYPEPIYWHRAVLVLWVWDNDEDRRDR